MIDTSSKARPARSTTDHQAKYFAWELTKRCSSDNLEKLAAATERGLSLTQLAGFEAIAGHGIMAQVDGRAVLVGNPRLMQSRGLALNGLGPEVDRLQAEAKTALLVARDGAVIGVIAVADTIKAGSVEAIAELHALGLEVIMLTGDNQKAADAIGRAAGVDRVIAEVLPADKAGGEATASRRQGGGDGGRWH